jgi:YggT family protein
MSFLYSFIQILGRALNLFILARVLLSWIPMARENRLVQFIYEATEPILAPIRRLLPAMGGLDLSPIIALLLVEIAQRVLLTLIVRLA